MRISTLAIANLKRRPGKAAFLVAGIAIGIGTAVALLSLSASIRREIGTQLDQFGANIAVLPKSDSLSLNYGGVSVSSVAFDDQQLSSEDARAILDIPFRNRIAVVAPKLLGGVEVDGRRAVLAGVNFESELRLKRWWQLSGAVPKSADEVMLGYEAALALGVVDAHGGHRPVAPPAGAHHAAEDQAPIRLVRDRLNIAGQEHRVVGVLAATAGPEDRMIFASLEHAQAVLKQPGRLSLVEVSALCKDCPVNDIVAQIANRLPHVRVVAVQQSVRAREQAVDRLTRFFSAVSVVVLAVGALLIFTSMTGSVLERTREIGVMRAIGFRKSHIMRGLLVEVTVISLLGGFAGWAAGTAASWAALPHFAETAAAFELRPWFIPAAISAALLLGILSGLLPILRASRLDPSEAVRSN